MLSFIKSSGTYFLLSLTRTATGVVPTTGTTENARGLKSNGTKTYAKDFAKKIRPEKSKMTKKKRTEVRKIKLKMKL